MKNFNLIAAFLICSLIYQAKPDSELPPLIIVTGTGEVKLRPDYVTVNVGIQMRNVDLTTVRQETDKKAADVIAYLKDQGIEDKDIQTSYLSLQPNYPNVDFNSPDAANIDQTKPNYYSAQKSTTFRLRDLSKYDNVMAGLYELGINSVDGVDFGVTDEEKGKIEAKTKAVENARNIANVLAKKLKVKLGKVFSVSEGNAEQSTPFASESFGGFAVAAAVVSSGPSISGGEITIAATVNLSFRIQK